MRARSPVSAETDDEGDGVGDTGDREPPGAMAVRPSSAPAARSSTEVLENASMVAKTCCACDASGLGVGSSLPELVHALTNVSAMTAVAARRAVVIGGMRRPFGSARATLPSPALNAMLPFTNRPRQ